MEQWIPNISFWLCVLSSMLSVSSVLDSYSKSGPNTDEVLFKEDLSLADRLGPKMASKSMLDTLSSGAALDPKICPDLRCMYNFKIQGEWGLLSTCLA